MATFLPNTKTTVNNTWQSTPEMSPPRTRTPFRPLESGTRRDFSKQWGGNPESDLRTIGRGVDFLKNNALNFAILSSVKKTKDAVKEGAEETTEAVKGLGEAPGLGTPKPKSYHATVRPGSTSPGETIVEPRGALGNARKYLPASDSFDGPPSSSFTRGKDLMAGSHALPRGQDALPRGVIPAPPVHHRIDPNRDVVFEASGGPTRVQLKHQGESFAERWFGKVQPSQISVIDAPAHVKESTKFGEVASLRADPVAQRAAIRRNY